MMKKSCAVFAMVSLGALFLIGPAMSEMTTTPKLESVYRGYIDEFISRCDSKSARSNATCQNIRREANLAQLKAKYYRKHKEKLVQDMINNDVGVKRHKIRYYLISEFFASYRINNSKFAETRSTGK